LPSDKGSGEGWRLPTLEEVQKELIEIRRRRLLDKCRGDGKHVPSVRCQEWLEAGSWGRAAPIGPSS
jgi:hypothetical protein